MLDQSRRNAQLLEWGQYENLANAWPHLVRVGVVLVHAHVPNGGVPHVGHVALHRPVVILQLVALVHGEKQPERINLHPAEPVDVPERKHLQPRMELHVLGIFRARYVHLERARARLRPVERMLELVHLRTDRPEGGRLRRMHTLELVQICVVARVLHYARQRLFHIVRLQALRLQLLDLLRVANVEVQIERTGRGHDFDLQVAVAKDALRFAKYLVRHLRRKH